jgi:hypothetical protein
MSDRNVPAKTARGDVAAFLAKAKSLPVPAAGAAPRGRLVFAMDATASREPSWERARRLQGDMFLAARDLGGLAIQLVHYGGLADFEASPWVASGTELVARMNRVRCAPGETQIANVLRHAEAETKARKVNAVVFVGDAVEESPDTLAELAGRLGLAGVPVFVFHEGGDPVARAALEAVARLSGGAYCPFDAGSADQLRDLLAAAASFAAGGRNALADFTKLRGPAAAGLLAQMKK